MTKNRFEERNHAGDLIIKRHPTIAVITIVYNFLIVNISFPPPQNIPQKSSRSVVWPVLDNRVGGVPTSVSDMQSRGGAWDLIND